MKHKSIGQQRRKRHQTIAISVTAVVTVVVVCILCLLLRRGDKVPPQTDYSFSPDPTVTAGTTASSDTPTPSPSPEPTSTPTPTPTPEPVMLSSLDGYDPGDVIEDSLIDTGNLDQYFTISEIQTGDDVYLRIYGQSFVENNDIALQDLRYLKMLHVNFDGCYQVGEMIVNATVAQQVTEIFEALCENGYQIYSMYLIDDFWVGNGTDSDTNSIEYNNTSCFCYRAATGGSNISRHALGLAIDLNPQQNPDVSTGSDGSLHWSHENASDYVYDRSSSTPHVITESDYAYQLFTSYGWTWGGSWNNPRDYQHFQYS